MSKKLFSQTFELVCLFVAKSRFDSSLRLNPIPPGGWGGGGGGAAESARADFNFRELPLYLSKTYQM